MWSWCLCDMRNGTKRMPFLQRAYRKFARSISINLYSENQGQAQKAGRDYVTSKNNQN